MLTKEIVQLGMTLLKYFPCNFVDDLVLLLSKLQFGDTTKYGIVRPSKGPFYLKQTTGRSPVIDVGTLQKIRSGDIQVHNLKKTHDYYSHILSLILSELTESSIL